MTREQFEEWLGVPAPAPWRQAARTSDDASGPDGAELGFPPVNHIALTMRERFGHCRAFLQPHGLDRHPNRFISKHAQFRFNIASRSERLAAGLLLATAVFANELPPPGLIKQIQQRPTWHRPADQDCTRSKAQPEPPRMNRIERVKLRHAAVRFMEEHQGEVVDLRKPVDQQ